VYTTSDLFTIVITQRNNVSTRIQKTVIKFFHIVPKCEFNKSNISMKKLLAKKKKFHDFRGTSVTLIPEFDKTCIGVRKLKHTNVLRPAVHHDLRTKSHKISSNSVCCRCDSFSMAQEPLVGQGLLIIEALRSHSDTPRTVGLLWTSD
jgi:hypothetical protein